MILRALLLSTITLAGLSATASAQSWIGPRTYYPPGYLPPGYYPAPAPVVVPLDRKYLERTVEYRLRSQLGPWVKDVDVDVDTKRGKLEVEIEVRRGVPCHVVHQQAWAILHSMPELRGFRIELEIDD